MENDFSRKTKLEKGFSLVELMTVIAIIGILATVAMPSIKRYMVKARQSEVKANLSGLYGANQVFFAENNIFENQFTVVGFKLEGRNRYNIGFNALPVLTLAQLQNFGYSGQVLSTAQNTAELCASAVSTCSLSPDAGTTPDAAGCTSALLNTLSYTACAAGKITDRTVMDGWSINQRKILTNTQDGGE